MGLCLVLAREFVASTILCLCYARQGHKMCFFNKETVEGRDNYEYENLIFLHKMCKKSLRMG